MSSWVHQHQTLNETHVGKPHLLPPPSHHVPILGRDKVVMVLGGGRIIGVGFYFYEKWQS